jgi:hypothetical protein
MAGIKFRIANANLSRWFPAGDEVAAHVARLCILREDFYLEFALYMTESLAEVDDNGRDWRRIYCFRRMAQTLMEIKSTLTGLLGRKEYKRHLSEHLTLRERLEGLKRILDANHDLIKDMRNSLSGHVPQKAVATALNNMHMDVAGLLQRGQHFRDTHFKFAAEMILAMMFRDTPAADQARKADNDTKRFVESVFDLLPVLDGIILSYAQDRGVLV